MWRTDRRLAREEGITIVEVVIAASLLLGGVMAGFLALDSASSAGKTAERQAIAAAMGEQQIERLLAMSWNQLAHCSTPTPSSDPKSPTHYVQAGTPTRFKVLDDYRRPSLGPLEGTLPEGEELVLQTAPTTTPCNASTRTAVFHGPIPFTSGTATGSIYQFISWRDDTCLPTLPAELSAVLNGITGLVAGLLTQLQSDLNLGVNAFCLQPRDSKRITVAVVLDPASDYGPDRATWVSTVQTNSQDGVIIDSNGRYDFSG